MPIERRKWITRQMLRYEPNTLFVFGDNIARHGFGGQAKEMRGEPNAVGIPTKWHPYRTDSAYFQDSDYAKIQSELDAVFNQLTQHLLQGGKVIIPLDGIGTGLAQLKARAPLIFKNIQDRLTDLEKVYN